MFQFYFHTSYFRFYIDHISQWNGKLRSPDHKRCRTVCFGLHDGYGGKITHLSDHRLHVFYRVLSHYLQFQCLFQSDVLLHTNGADIGNHLFRHFKLLNECFVNFTRLLQKRNHQAFTGFTFT